MRGFLVLGSILALLVGWLFWATTDANAQPPAPAYVWVPN